MDKSAAIQSVQKTFLFPFEENKFKTFSRNMFKGLNESKAFSVGRAQVKEAFSAHVKSYKRIGQYKDPNGEVLDVLIVKLDKISSLDKARTLQRNFVADYLKQRDNHDAAIVAFHHEGMEDWRFSFVKMEYKTDFSGGKIKVKTDLTPARRYSFLVGENEPNHTAQQQITPLLEREDKYSISTVEDAFNIESITKEFFNKYKELFLELKEELDNLIQKDICIKEDFEKHELTSEAFAKKLLGQIVFLYFLQKKGWLGVKQGEKWGTGSKSFLKDLFEKKSNNNFFNDVLEFLFYDALAVKHKNDFCTKFNCKLPFLNGGLFDPINDYDWQNTNITISNSTFKKIFKAFDLYNFTVKEDEPLDKEVAIDPEMLGKVFENLLEVKDRKSKGAFYTPREIVHYMCQESLINYLDVKLNTEKRPIAEPESVQGSLFGDDNIEDQLTEDVYIEKVPKKEIEEFIRRGDIYIDYAIRNKEKRESGNTVSGVYKERELPKSIILRADKVDELLHEVKICDPAIGSGAFPVGLMNEIIRARYALSAYGEPNPDRTIYNFKRHCIKESIYGVDIDQSAVEIAKLRLWLSLVVDEEDLDSIEPLPNLDYKIVCGNSLIGFPENFRSSTSEELQLLLDKHFEETDKIKKNNLKAEIDEKINRWMLNSKATLGYQVNFDFRLFFVNVFKESKGFDIVIGNPPYVQIQKFSSQEIQNDLEKQKYNSFSKTADLYCLFYEQGNRILNGSGHLCLITSNKWMRANYGKLLRKYLSNNTNPVQIIDFAGHKVFDSATVDTNILIFCKNIKRNLPNACTVSKDFNSATNIPEYVLNKTVKLEKLTEKSWIIIPKEKFALKKKIEKAGTSLKDWDININRGVLTGCNEAFIIDRDTKEKLIKADTKNAEIIKPILRGRDISRYKAEFADLWLINAHNGYISSINGIKKIPPVNVKRDYPVIYDYLESVGNKIKSEEIKVKAKGVFNRDDQGVHWSNLRNCAYLEEFEKEKIIFTKASKVQAFAYDSSKTILLQTAYYCTGENLKFLLSILNSNLVNYAFINFYQSGGIQGEITVQSLNKIPIPQMSQKIQQPFIDLVDIILTKKEKGEDTTKEESQIDRLVYKLYDLTDEEIKIVEDSVK